MFIDIAKIVNDVNSLRFDIKSILICDNIEADRTTSITVGRSAENTWTQKQILSLKVGSYFLKTLLEQPYLLICLITSVFLKILVLSCNISSSCNMF